MTLLSKIPNNNEHNFVIWILNPIDRIMTIRPSWDLKQQITLSREFPDKYYGGQLYPIAKQLKEYGYYPHDQKIMPAVRRVWEYYMEGYYIYPGRNVIIDPWYYEGDKCIDINFITGELHNEYLQRGYRKAKK